MIAYYSLKFSNADPAFLVRGREQIEDMAVIEKNLVNALNEAGISTRHEHASVDGSLSRFALTDLPEAALKDQLALAIAGLPLTLCEVKRLDGERDLGYVGGRRVRLDQLWNE